MTELIFKISENKFIKIVPDYDLDFNKVTMCDDLKVYFVNERQLRIGQQSAGLIFDDFIECLKKAIHHKLQLHESLIHNLGFMENEYSHEYSHKNPGFIMISSPSGESSYWVGSNYNIWRTFADANPYVNTWMYNDHEGNIIFEVTKFYKWSMQEDDLDDLNFITYEEFMKDYKPLIHCIISHDVAIKWLEQAEKWYKIIYDNEQNLQ